MRKRLIFLSFLLPAMMFAANLDAQTIFFPGDIEEAQTSAAIYGKPFAVYFTATWCMPCQWMEKNTFSDPFLGDFINEHFIVVKIDVDEAEGSSCQETYKVDNLPTILIFNSQGELMERLKSSYTALQLKEVLEIYITYGQITQILDSPKHNLLLSRPALIPEVEEEPLVMEPYENDLIEDAGYFDYDKPDGYYSEPSYYSPDWSRPHTSSSAYIAPRTPDGFTIQVGVFREFDNASSEKKKAAKLTGTNSAHTIRNPIR